MNIRNILSWTALTGLSLGFHLVAFSRMNSQAWGTTLPKPKAPSLVEMAIATPPPKAAAPAEKPAAPTRAARRLAVASPSALRGPAPRPAPPTSAPAPVAETVADFSGTTLTNDGAGSGWASATGNGDAMRRPVGRPGAKVTARHVEGAPSKPSAPAIVAVADLSSPPVPPALDAALELNYPAEARRTGQAGKAVVRARISSQGQALDLAVVSESGDGFGDACKKTLASSRWTPPLDREGTPVATVIQYTCRFVVR